MTCQHIKVVWNFHMFIASKWIGLSVFIIGFYVTFEALKRFIKEYIPGVRTVMLPPYYKSCRR